MNTYRVSVTLEVDVSAFDPKDALSAVEDVFGTGDTCGLEVKEYKVLEYAELV
jgi:hypothetical protein